MKGLLLATVLLASGQAINPDIFFDERDKLDYALSGFSSVKDDLAKFNYKSDNDLNENGFKFVNYVRSDNYNYFYFETNYAFYSAIQDTYALISYVNTNEKIDDYSKIKYDNYSTYKLTYISGYCEKKGTTNYFYKYALKSDSILNASRVVINQLRFKLNKVNTGFSSEVIDINACYLYNAPTNNKVVKQAKKVSKEEKIKLTASTAFDDVVSTNYSFIERMFGRIDDVYTMSYFLFNTSIDNWMDSITDITLEYSGYDCYFSYDRAPSFNATTATYLLKLPYDELLEKYNNSAAKYSHNEKFLSNTISLNKNDSIRVTETKLFGYKNIYDYKQLFNQSDMSDYPFIKNKMESGNYNHGCLFSSKIRTAVDDIAHIIGKPTITGPEIIEKKIVSLDIFRLSEVKALDITYLKNGLSYTADFDDNKTISTGQEKEPIEDGKTPTTEDPNWLKKIKDFLNNASEFLKVFAIITGSLLLACLVISLLPVLTPVFKGIGYVISLPFKLIKKKKKDKENGNK